MTDFKSFKSDIKKLRSLLIVLTLIQIGYIIVIFMSPKLLVKLNLDYKVNWLIFGLHYLTAGIFIWFNWNKMPITKKAKTNYTVMILLLGIIGMWLWIPNKQEVNKWNK